MTDQERDGLYAEAEKLRVAGDYETAQPKYAQILETFSEDGEAHQGMGHCLLNTGMFEESLDAFKKAVSLGPENVSFLLNYGKTLCMLGEYPDAKAQFEKVLSIDPDNDDAMEQMLYFPDDE